MDTVSTSRGLRFAAGRLRALEPALVVEGIRPELIANLQERGLGDSPVFRPHIDRMTAGVAEGIGKLDRRSEELDCLGTCEHGSYAKPI